jgi:hypothetical protein
VACSHGWEPDAYVHLPERVAIAKLYRALWAWLENPDEPDDLGPVLAALMAASMLIPTLVVMGPALVRRGDVGRADGPRARGNARLRRARASVFSVLHNDRSGGVTLPHGQYDITSPNLSCSN